MDEQHLSYRALAALTRVADPDGFDARIHRMHDGIMTTLAEMLSQKNPDCACDLCPRGCLKPALTGVDISLSEVRGASLRQYLKTLDEIGVPGEASLTWVAQLPV